MQSARRHGRNISHPAQRRNTVGPLAVTDDPLSAPATDNRPPPSEPTAAATATAISVAVQSDHDPLGASRLPQEDPQHMTVAAASALVSHPFVNLHFLQERGTYHQLPSDDVPAAFWESPHRPAADASLPSLLEGGHFRLAAETAVTELSQCAPDDVQRLLQLFYTRLACLILVSRPDLAAQEALPLTDFVVRNSTAGNDVTSVLPWDLRLLLVRLQGIGSADGGRRGVMALYALAGEVRSQIRQRSEDTHVALWKDRLADLGLRVCDALVEMGELETALRHLDTLADVQPDERRWRQSLLHLRAGDISAAQRSASQLQDDTKRRSLSTLLQLADGSYEAALLGWQDLAREFPQDENFALNAALALVYTRHVATALTALESLVDQVPVFPALLFNLGTLYELCSERAVDFKFALTQRVALKKPHAASGGWERANLEFKL